MMVLLRSALILVTIGLTGCVTTPEYSGPLARNCNLERDSGDKSVLRMWKSDTEYGVMIVKPESGKTVEIWSTQDGKLIEVDGDESKILMNISVAFDHHLDFINFLRTNLPTEYQERFAGKIKVSNSPDDYRSENVFSFVPNWERGNWNMDYKFTFNFENLERVTFPETFAGVNTPEIVTTFKEPDSLKDADKTGNLLASWENKEQWGKAACTAWVPTEESTVKAKVERAKAHVQEVESPDHSAAWKHFWASLVVETFSRDESIAKDWRFMSNLKIGSACFDMLMALKANNQGKALSGESERAAIKAALTEKFADSPAMAKMYSDMRAEISDEHLGNTNWESFVGKATQDMCLKPVFSYVDSVPIRTLSH